MHLGRVLSGGWLLFFVPLLCDVCVGMHCGSMCVQGSVCVCGGGQHLAVVCVSVWGGVGVFGGIVFLSTLKIFAFL